MLEVKELFKKDTDIINKIWELAWPLIVGQFLHTLMIMVDLWFIAKLGSIETAAVGVSTAIIGVIQVLPFLIATGAIALVSRATGSEDKEAVKGITLQSLALSIIIGIATLVILYFNIDFTLKIYGTADVTVLGEAKKYIQIALLGLPFFFFNASSKSIIQATGDTKNPVIIFLVMNIMNIVLDYLFIFQLNLGIRGAALATTISETIAFVFMLLLIVRNIFNYDIKEIIRKLKLEVRTIKRIFGIGGYSVVHMITRPLTGLILYRIVLQQGVEAGAAFGIGAKLFNFVFIFLAGLGTAMSVLVGQSLGRQDFAGAEQTVKQGIKLAIYNMLFFAIPFFIFPYFLMRFFVADTEVIRVGMEYLRICYAGVIFVIFPNVMGGAFIGAGNTFPPMIASVIGNWIVKLPFAYVLSKLLGLGTSGVWIAISLSVVAEALVVLFCYRSGRWKEKCI